MSAVDPLFAQWLQAEADFTVRSDAAGAARWGASGVTSERVTGIATRSAAEAEGDRVLAFLSRGPFTEETHDVVGTDWQRSIGTVVTFTIDQLGYDAGVDVFVLGAECNRATGISQVTVLRPLRGLS